MVEVELVRVAVGDDELELRDVAVCALVVEEVVRTAAPGCAGVVDDELPEPHPATSPTIAHAVATAAAVDGSLIEESRSCWVRRFLFAIPASSGYGPQGRE